MHRYLVKQVSHISRTTVTTFREISSDYGTECIASSGNERVFFEN